MEGCLLPDIRQNRSELLNLASKPLENTRERWSKPPEPKTYHVAMASHFVRYPTRETVAEKAVGRLLLMVRLIPAGSHPQHSME